MPARGLLHGRQPVPRLDQPDRRGSPEQRDALLAGLDASLEGLAAEPTVFRAFHLEIIQIGAAALELRRDVLLIFVSMLSRDAVEYVDGVLARELLQQ